MMPIAPTIAVHPLQRAERDACAELLNRRLLDSAYSLPMDAKTLDEQLFLPDPPTVFDVRWSKRLVLGAWRAGEMIGVLDAATGHHSGNLDLPEFEPEGLLRFLVFGERDDLVNDTFRALMDRAHTFWREEHVRQVTAFHISTGYPLFQAGAGVMPSDWSNVLRMLTGENWMFSERYYALVRSLGGALEEETPLADLSLVQQRTTNGRHYQLYHRRVDWIGRARMIGMTLDRADTVERVAHLVDLEVSELWRNRNIGKWLLRRLLNDATQQGFQEMLVYLPVSAAIAMNLFLQHGFHELNYRGYTFEKELGN